MENTSIFNRVNPEQKLHLIEYFQQQGQVVVTFLTFITLMPKWKEASSALALLLAALFVIVPEQGMAVLVFSSLVLTVTIMKKQVATAFMLIVLILMPGLAPEDRSQH